MCHPLLVEPTTIKMGQTMSVIVFEFAYIFHEILKFRVYIKVLDRTPVCGCGSAAIAAAARGQVAGDFQKSQ